MCSPGLIQGKTASIVVDLLQPSLKYKSSGGLAEPNASGAFLKSVPALVLRATTARMTLGGLEVVKTETTQRGSSTSLLKLVHQSLPPRPAFCNSASKQNNILSTFLPLISPNPIPNTSRFRDQADARSSICSASRSRQAISGLVSIAYFPHAHRLEASPAKCL